jgi:hypothetical protein
MAAEYEGPAAERDFDRASRWAAIVESSADAIMGARRRDHELESRGRADVRIREP